MAIDMKISKPFQNPGTAFLYNDMNFFMLRKDFKFGSHFQMPSYDVVPLEI